MKKLLFLVSLAGATWCLAPTTARAQTTPDTTRTAPPTAKPQLNTGPPGAPAPAPAPAAKPQLNTTPPGTPARPARPSQGQYEVTRPAVPVAPPPPVNQPLPAPRPNPSSPSGLEFPAGSRASEQPKPLRRYFLYSNFGLGFSSIYNQTRFNVSAAPALGYRVTDKFSIGPGISYSYSSLSFQGGGPSLRMNSLGVKGFAQYMVYGDFFLHGEYEVTRAEVPFLDQNNNIFVGKLTVKTPLAGAGYRQHFSDRIAADIVVLYNFNGNGLDDIYGQPVIRFSFLYELGR